MELEKLKDVIKNIDNRLTVQMAVLTIITSPKDTITDEEKQALLDWLMT